MSQDSTSFNPKLRPLEVRRVQQDGQRYYLLSDSLGLGTGPALVPEALGPFLALCDGTRSLETLAAAFRQRTGVDLSLERIRHILASFSEGLLLDDAKFTEAYGKAVKNFRALPYRPLSHAGAVYPSDPNELVETFDRYIKDAGVVRGTTGFGERQAVGLVSPHIDYERGWKTYAYVWAHAASLIVEADVAIVFGTDHSGGPGKLTFTRQSYATPFGPLPTEVEIVDKLAKALGEKAAFSEEYHHRHEHSIELALVWLDYFARPKVIPVVPVLCGSFYPFLLGQSTLEANREIETAIRVIKEACGQLKVLYVAAGDFAHVGPVFGDSTPWMEKERTKLREADGALLESIEIGDHKSFFEHVRDAGDRNRICGTPPIYMMLRMLEGTPGVTMGYDQCPADPESSSYVSIAGALVGPSS